MTSFEDVGGEVTDFYIYVFMSVCVIFITLLYRRFYRGQKRKFGFLRNSGKFSENEEIEKILKKIKNDNLAIFKQNDLNINQ